MGEVRVSARCRHQINVPYAYRLGSNDQTPAWEDSDGRILEDRCVLMAKNDRFACERRFSRCKAVGNFGGRGDEPGTRAMGAREQMGRHRNWGSNRCFQFVLALHDRFSVTRAGQGRAGQRERRNEQVADCWLYRGGEYEAGAEGKEDSEGGWAGRG
jgi:hypothetical protein